MIVQRQNSAYDRTGSMFSRFQARPMARFFQLQRFYQRSVV